MPKPPKTNPVVIDRSQYADALNKPFSNTGQSSAIAQGGYGYGQHANLTNIGAKLLTGTPGGKDAVYLRNGNLLMAHPSGAGWQDVGAYNPQGIVKPVSNIPVNTQLPKNNTPNPADVVVKPTTFNPSGTYNPNTGVNKDYNGNIVKPIVQQYKHGGLIKKLRGYADGGETSDNGGDSSDSGSNTAALVGMGAGLATQYATSAIDKAAQDSQGRYIRKTYQNDPTHGKLANFYNVGTLSGGLEGAGKGAAMGAALGPQGALIGAGVGALAGGIKGTLQANRDAKSISAEKDLMTQQQLQEVQDKKTALGQSAIDLRNSQIGYKDGGTIKGNGSGKSDSITAKIKPNSFVVPSENSDKAKAIRKVILKAPSKKANLNQKGGTNVKLSNDEVLFTPKEVEKVENALGDGVLDKLAPNAKKDLPGDKQQLIKQKELLGFKDGGNLANSLKSGNKTDSSSKKTSYPKPVKKTAIVNQSRTSNGRAGNSWRENDPETLNAYTGNGSGTDTDLSQDKTPGNYNRSNSFNLSNLGDAATAAIPILQTGYGLSQLHKLGKRPVGELDADYLKSIQSAQGNVDLANSNAKFGFTPEEQAQINNENQNLTNAQRYDARNLSGGSNANAFNMERAGINNAFDRALKAKVANRNLIMDKQGIANDRQQYLDSLRANKANMSRTLFNDKMNAFNTNQQAASGLLGAGLSNIIQGKRYADELTAMKKTQGIRNSFYDTLPQ